MTIFFYFCNGFGAGFDSLKYDLKRIEEVRYDLSIRGLGVQPAQVVEGAGSQF